MPIARLSDHLVNLIAAGEVVERPSAVVRELVDNALDAGATKITISVVEGGLDLISVTDDGVGIPHEEAILAFERHATSKLADPKDLEAIATLGFRGEALASIAAVARVRMLTRTALDALATEVLIAGGIAQPAKLVPGPKGTTVEVAQLFFNQPARKKFMKQPRTELARIRTHIRAIALVAPKVHIVLRADGEEIENLPPTASFAQRARAVLSDVDGDLLSFSEAGEVMVVEGAVSDPGKPAKQAAVAIVNGHVVQDRMILRAIREGYGGMLKSFELPGGCVVISIRPDLIDVNVHPQKSEVRFRDGSAVFVAVRGAVQRALERSLLAPVLSHAQSSDAISHESVQGTRVTSSGGRAAPMSTFSSSGFSSSVFPHQTRIPLSTTPFSRPGMQSPFVSGFDGGSNAVQLSAIQPSAVQSSVAPAPQDVSTAVAHHSIRLLGQVMGCFILGEDTERDEVVCIDMHAAHERINFNKIRDRLLNRLSPDASAEDRALPSQELLVPITLTLSGEELDVLEQRAKDFSSFGFRTELAPGGKIAIVAAPTIIAAKRIERVFREALEACVAHDFSRPFAELIDRVAARLACHASIRGGDSISIAEGYALLDALIEAETSGACPHGRPVMQRFPRTAVERWFGRDH